MSNTMNYSKGSKGASTSEDGRSDGTVHAMGEQTMKSLNEAREKTTRAVQRGYNQTVDYARQHPLQLNLIMLGSGIAIGMLVASRVSNRRMDYKRVASPFVEALADMGRRMLTR